MQCLRAHGTHDLALFLLAARILIRYTAKAIEVALIVLLLLEARRSRS